MGEEPSWATISPLLDEALQELPDDARAILIAHYLEAHSQLELSQELGLSQPTVSRRLAAAVVQLRALLIAKGVVAGAVLACLVQGSACATVPATLALELGTLTLAGQAGLGAGIGAATSGAATATAAKAATTITISAASLIALTNFTITRSGLEAQLLGLTILKEKPQLEAQKSELLQKQEKLKARSLFMHAPSPRAVSF